MEILAAKLKKMGLHYFNHDGLYVKFRGEVDLRGKNAEELMRQKENEIAKPIEGYVERIMSLVRKDPKLSKRLGRGIPCIYVCSIKRERGKDFFYLELSHEDPRFHALVGRAVEEWLRKTMRPD